MLSHLHFSLGFIIAALAAGNVSAANAPRQLSEETAKLLNSRLIFVYDDEGCREIEGMSADADQHLKAPFHRSLALQELERRIDLEFRNRKSLLDTNAWQYSGQQHTPRITSAPVNTVYLESLEMEIAHVPQGMTLPDLERVATDLPCVKYIARDDIKYVENNYEEAVMEQRQIARPSDQSYPADPLYKYQWSLHHGNSTKYGIDAQGVWQDWNWQGSPSMTVAVIDSGCNVDHPDLRHQLWRNTGETDCNNGIDDDGNGFIDDCHGWDFLEDDSDPSAKGTSHGTAAAGIIAAQTHNGEGIAGVCPECKIMCLRFISNTEGTVANEVRAIDYAVRMGAKISNNSYGGYAHSGSRVEQDAIERANRKGHIFVTSAGNNNIGTDNSEFIHTPSGYSIPNVLSVGASTEGGRKTSFSNYGKQTVHMFAPGRNIISTGKDGYLINQGTSFAAPHVAGVAALIWSRFPELTADQLVHVLLRSCRTAPELKSLSFCGGVINASMAMQRAEQVLRSPIEVTSGILVDRPLLLPRSQHIDSLEPPETIAFPPIPFGAHNLSGTGARNEHHTDHHNQYNPLDLAPASTDIFLPIDPPSKSFVPADVYLPISAYPPSTDYIPITYPASHGGFWAPGIRASSLGGSNNGLLSTTKRLIKSPVNGVMDLVNAGLDWIPSLSAIAQYISPSNHIGYIPGAGPVITPFGTADSLGRIAGLGAGNTPQPPSGSSGLFSGDGIVSSLLDGGVFGGVLDGFSVKTGNCASTFVGLLSN